MYTKLVILSLSYLLFLRSMVIFPGIPRPEQRAVTGNY